MADQRIADIESDNIAALIEFYGTEIQNWLTQAINLT